QHRLVVLVLVGEQHLVDEAVGEQRVLRVEFDLTEHLKRPLADLPHVGANLVGAQDGELAADLPRLLDRVVELPDVAAERLAGTDRADEPELLEVRDVTEVPDQRTEDGVVDAVELLVGERLDQLERVSTCLLQTPGQLGLAVRSGTRSTRSGGCDNLRDRSRVPRRTSPPARFPSLWTPWRGGRRRGPRTEPARR